VSDAAFSDEILEQGIQNARGFIHALPARKRIAATTASP